MRPRIASVPPGDWWLQLARFGGHIPTWETGVHHGQIRPPVPAGVPDIRCQAGRVVERLGVGHEPGEPGAGWSGELSLAPYGDRSECVLAASSICAVKTALDGSTGDDWIERLRAHAQFEAEMAWPPPQRARAHSTGRTVEAVLGFWFALGCTIVASIVTILFLISLNVRQTAGQLFMLALFGALSIVGVVASVSTARVIFGGHDGLRAPTRRSVARATRAPARILRLLRSGRGEAHVEFELSDGSRCSQRIRPELAQTLRSGDTGVAYLLHGHLVDFVALSR